ncbi:MAG: hypothetical protein JXA66_03725 [Oligoflexia bacterium]|nr:hypothetical protein [Oligoflexia bacterium]
MLKIRSFKGRILYLLLLSYAFTLVSGLVAIFTINSIVDGPAQVYTDRDNIKLAARVEAFKKGFELYKYDINRLIATGRPLKYSDIVNNPLRKSLAAGIQEITVLAQAFDDYNRNLPKSGEAELLRVIADIEKPLFAARKDETGSLFSTLGFIRIIIILILLALPVFALMIYLKAGALSANLGKTTEAVRNMEYSDFDPDVVSGRIPLVAETESEFFELASVLSRLAYIIHGEKQRIYDYAEKAENENSRHRILTSYANAILNSLDVGIMVTDNLNKVSYVNSAFETYWRVHRGAILEQDISELAFVGLIKGWKEALLTPPASFTGRYKMSGTSPMKEIMFSVLPVYDKTGREKLGTVSITKEA